MKSTPYELRAYYLPGAAPNTPEAERRSYPGIRMVGGFQFTDGAMSLRLTQLKSERQAKYLWNFHKVQSEVLEVVNVPQRAQAFSPKSEFEGVLGAVGPDASADQGQPPAGLQAAGTGAGKPATLEADRASNRERRAHAGSSVASKATVDPAVRERLLGGGSSADTVKVADLKTDDAGGLT